MKKQLQIVSLPLACLLATGVNYLWSTDVPKTGCVNRVFSDTLPKEEPFKNKYEYDKDGRTSQLETKSYIYKIEYDTRCNKQTRTTKITKSTGDSAIYNYTYDTSCQLLSGESSSGIKLKFKFDSKQRLITIIDGARKINIVYNDSSLPKKISLGNRDYLDNVYDSSGRIVHWSSYHKSWWRAPVGTYRVLKIMYSIIDEAKTLFGQLLKFNPGFDMSEVHDLFRELSSRPPFIEWPT